jgi:succinyl-CoA synthetase alpha subunit
MAILLDKRSRILVQGGGDEAGRLQVNACRDYAHGRRCFVAAVAADGAPHAGLPDMPVFGSVAEARAATGANASVVCAAPGRTLAAIEEAAAAGVALVVCMSNGVPAKELLPLRRRLQRSGTRLVGPGCAGVVTPGEVKVGALPGDVHRRGRIGIVSRSQSLTTYAARQLALFGLGTSTVVGLAEEHHGPTHLELLQLFDQDRGTDAVLLIGDIDEDEQEACAAWIATHGRKPLAGWVGDDAAAAAGHARLRACGVQVPRDAGAMGELVASLVEPRWLPFD